MACGSTSPSEEDLARIDAIIVTDLGEVAIELYDHTPIHRDNFLKLAKEDFFDSLAFHRVIYEFMIQVGDPRTRLSYPAVDTSLDDGPGYDLPGEMGPQSIHTPGKIGAARQPDDKNPEKRSAGSQFYIVSEGEAQPRELIDSMEVVYTGMVRGRIYQAYQKAIAEGRYEGSKSKETTIFCRSSAHSKEYLLTFCLWQVRDSKSKETTILCGNSAHSKE